MISLKEKISVAAPPDDVWPLLSDPAVVAACIPGAELNELTPEGAHRGRITFKFGPTVSVFRGEAKLTYNHPVKRCLIVARGIDQKGASRARALNWTRVARTPPMSRSTAASKWQARWKCSPRPAACMWRVRSSRNLRQTCCE